MSKPNPSRIKPPPYKFRNKNINEKKIVSDYSASLQPPTLKFSFQFLDFNDPSFQINDCDSAWFIQLFERKKNYCTMNPTLIKMGGDATRCHPIDWEKTEKPKGFNIRLSFDVDAYQLTISKNHGRIIGFFTEDVFNVVWFDPYHSLYA